MQNLEIDFELSLLIERKMIFRADFDGHVSIKTFFAGVEKVICANLFTTLVGLDYVRSNLERGKRLTLMGIFECYRLVYSLFYRRSSTTGEV